MVGHDFIYSGTLKFWYNLVFNQDTRETINLPAPSLFDLFSGRYTIMLEDIYAYWGLTQPTAPEPEPVAQPVYQWDPQDPVYHWNPREPPHYPGEGYFDPWP